MSRVLRSMGLFGVVLFGLMFAVTFLSPQAIENSARGFVKYQIEKEIREKQQGAMHSTVAQKAARLADSLGIESAKIQQDLDAKLPQKIASVIAAMCGYDCERKRLLAASITDNYRQRLQQITLGQATLGDLITGKYIEIVGNLKFDLRVFLGTNSAMFFVLLLLSFTRPTAMAHLFLPGLLLLLATLVSSAIYIFGQNWFYTILYNDYMGFGYLAYIAAIFGTLMDIALNKARVTTEIINALSNVIGSAFSVLPC